MNSKTVEELASAVSRLSAAELSAFSKWFEEFTADRWDEQIEADILAGRLDHVAERALRGGRSRFDDALARVPDLEPREEDRVTTPRSTQE